MRLTRLFPHRSFRAFRDDLLAAPGQRMFADPLFVGEGGAPAGGGQPGAGAAGGGAPAGGGQEPPPAEPPAVPEYVKELRTEAAGYRTKLRAAEDVIKSIQTELAELKTAGVKPPSPQAGGAPGTAEARLAQLERDLAAAQSRVVTLETTTKEAQTKAQHAQVDARLEQLTSGLNAKGAAQQILRTATKVAADGKVVFTVMDEVTQETREVEATAENLSKFKLLDPVFYPAKGRPGAGSGPSDVDAPVGLDLARMDDPEYYAKHRDEILAWRRKQPVR